MNPPVSNAGYDLFYGPEYVGAAYEFDTTRKARWIAESLAAAPIAGIRLVEPRSLTLEEVAAVHDPRYVHAVRDGAPRELAESQGFQWDEGLWRMVVATNGGAVAATRSALVFDWCRSRGTPVAFVLAGGYVGPRLDRETLVALHRQTIVAAATATS